MSVMGRKGYKFLT